MLTHQVKRQLLNLLIESLRHLNTEMKHPILEAALFAAEMISTWEQEQG